MAQISTDIETKTDTNLINAKGSGMGVYTEAGIKYILQNGFNIGYYMRQSSAVFELIIMNLNRMAPRKIAWLFPFCLALKKNSS